MGKVDVKVLYEIELIGVIAILANSIYTEERYNANYRKDVFSFFKDFKNHEAVLKYRLLEKDYMFYYDKPIMFMLDMKDEGRCSETLRSYVGDRAVACYQEFYALVKDFDKKSNFCDFFENYTKKFDMAIDKFEKFVPITRCLKFLTDLMQENLNKHLCVNLMFGITSANYGWQTGRACYCNIRPYLQNCVTISNSIYLETLIVHEFAHSIVNPITEKYSKKIECFADKNFIYCWNKNVYGDKQTVINENIIRAIECFYVEKYFSNKEAINLIDEYMEEGFEYILQVMEILKNGESLRYCFDNILNIFNNSEK